MKLAETDPFRMDTAAPGSGAARGASPLAKCSDEQGVALGFEVRSRGLELGKAPVFRGSVLLLGDGLYVFSKDICV